VNEPYVREASEFVTTLALKECHLPKIGPPAVLVGLTGQGRTRGMASVLLFESTISQHLAFIKPDSRADVSFLAYAFNMAYQYLRVATDAGGSTKGAITCEDLANIKLAVPPLSDQLAIVAHLTAVDETTHRLVTAAERAIALLEERRAAVISSAVTGQIDVRHHTELESAAQAALRQPIQSLTLQESE